jgi:hypothetical protein
MEGRDCVASWDAGLGIMTVYAATQSAHVSRIGVGACMDIEGDKVHVLARDIGGSFGLKIRASREELAVAAASRHLGRPVHGTMINRDKGGGFNWCAQRSWWVGGVLLAGPGGCGDGGTSECGAGWSGVAAAGAGADAE